MEKSKIEGLKCNSGSNRYYKTQNPKNDDNEEFLKHSSNVRTRTRRPGMATARL
jgi:hypothetical protein